MWYALDGCDRANLNRLLSEGIVADLVNINSPYQTQVLVFPADDFDKVMRILGLKIKNLKTISTEREGIRLIQDRIAEVRITSWDGGMGQSEFRSILQKYANEWEKDIQVGVPHGNSQSPIKDDAIHIWCWSTPGGADGTHLRKAFGITIPDNGTNDARRPSNKGEVIKDPEDIAVAEVLPGNIYILFDITHSGFSGWSEILTKIMDEAMPIAVGDPKRLEEICQRKAKEREEKEKQLLEDFKERYDQIRNDFVAVCAREINSEVTELEKQVDQSQKTIEKLSTQLVEQTRQFETMQTRLEDLKSGSGKEIERLAQEFENICKFPDVERVDIVDDVIEVYTREIKLKHEGRIYNLGKFKIEVGPGGLRIRSTTYPRKSRPHPHLSRDGSACFGNLQDPLHKYLVRYEYSIVIQLLLEFLHNYTPGDSMASIEKVMGEEED